ARQTPVGERPGVNFGWPRRQRLIPQSREQGAFTPIAQAVGAFAAHARRSSGTADAACSRERIEKLQLALGGPAVPANPRGGCGRAKRIGCAHPPAWITTASL